MARQIYHWEVNPEFRAILEQNGITGLDSLFRVSGSAPLNKPGLPGWRLRQRLELMDDHGGTRIFYLKTYQSPPFGVQAKRWLQGRFSEGTAFTEWSLARELQSCGIPALQGVAYGFEGSWPNENRSALITCAVGGRSLETCAADRGAVLLHATVIQLADLVRRLHGRGYAHRDLYLCHIFFEPPDKLRLIDLQRMIKPRWRRRRWWIKDLAALNYSSPTGFVRRTERCRFLLRYLAKDRMDREARQMARDTLRRTRRMAAHDVVKGRIQAWQRIWLPDDKSRAS